MYEHDRHLERGLKAKLVITELMLRKSGRGGRGGKRARSEVQQRLGRWSLGDQEALLAECMGRGPQAHGSRQSSRCHREEG